jgi:signal transduction histidine kinase
MEILETYPASIDRSTAKELNEAHKSLTKSGYITQIAEATNTLFMILDENRQIVLVNKQLLDLFDTDEESILGERPGEILSCVNAQKLPTGCGTHTFCRQCGALNAILSALDGLPANNECRISSRKDNKNHAYDLSVKANPFSHEGKNYVLFSVVDISDKKRKEVLENTFFHDILNTVGGVLGFSQLLKSELEESEFYESAEIIYDLSDKLVKEIQSQRMLVSAERGNLQVNKSEAMLTPFITSIINLIKENEHVKKCKLVFSEKGGEFNFTTDLTILQRILVNMIKNAAEASEPGASVTVSSMKIDNEVTFSVHNETVMPEKIKMQIFQRSFSTKGANRGIGTYSMKLFTEDYLGGNISFESEEGKGTTFTIRIPSE